MPFIQSTGHHCSPCGFSTENRLVYNSHLKTIEHIGRLAIFNQTKQQLIQNSVYTPDSVKPIDIGYYQVDPITGQPRELLVIKPNFYFSSETSFPNPLDPYMVARRFMKIFADKHALQNIQFFLPFKAKLRPKTDMRYQTFEDAIPEYQFEYAKIITDDTSASASYIEFMPFEGDLILEIFNQLKSVYLIHITQLCRRHLRPELKPYDIDPLIDDHPGYSPDNVNLDPSHQFTQYDAQKAYELVLGSQLKEFFYRMFKETYLPS
jgi:hypothetical protein